MSLTMRITPVGLGPQERTVLGVATKLLSALEVDVALLEEASPKANLAVIDGDSPIGAHYLTSPKAATLRVVIGGREQHGAGVLWLPRPVRVQGLKDAIYELWSRGETQGGGDHASSSPPANLGQGTPDTLFGAMRKARVAKQRVLFKSSGGHNILLDGTTGLFHTRFDSRELEAVAQAAGTASLLPPLGEQRLAEDGKAAPFSELVWMAAWFGSKAVTGEVWPEDRAARLKAFPRLPKLFLLPEYVQIAAMLTKGSLTPQQIANSTGISADRVIDFCRIAEVLNILEVTQSASAPRTNSGTAKGGLLAKLARKLALGVGGRS